MNIKMKLVLLGFVRRMVFFDISGARENFTWLQTMGIPLQTDKKRAGLFSTADSRELFIIPWSRPKIKNISPDDYRNLRLVAEKWFDYSTDEKIEIFYPQNMRTLKKIGQIKEIEYTSDKFENENDSGKWNLYLHEYTNNPDLFVNCPISPYCWGLRDIHERKLLTYRGLVL